MRCQWLYASLVLLAVTAALSAAPPSLPADALGDDVVGVLWIDAAQVDAGKLKAGVDAAMGRYAGVVNEALAPFARLHAPFVRAGGTSMAIVYFDPYSANSASRGVANPVYLFSMGNESNRSAIESVLASVSLDEKQNQVAKFRMIGKWLMAYDGRLAEPWMEKGAVDRMEVLSAALSPIARHPAVLAFAPSKRMQAAYAEKVGLDPHTPKDLILFVRTLLECRSLTITLTLGEQPSAQGFIRMPDAGAATQLVELEKPMLATLGAFMQKKDMRGTRIQIITQLASYHAVFTQAALQQNENQISASVSGAALKRTGEGIADGLALAREEALIVRSLNQMQALIVALNSYARDNGGRYPAKLSDLRDHSYVKDFDKLIVNPRTGQSPGYVYVRPSRTITDLARERRTASTPILYEASSGRINMRGLIGYANAQISRPDIDQ